MWLFDTDDGDPFYTDEFAGCKTSWCFCWAIDSLDDPVLPLHPGGEWKQGKAIELSFNRLEVSFSRYWSWVFWCPLRMNFPEWNSVLGRPWRKPLRAYFSIGPGASSPCGFFAAWSWFEWSPRWFSRTCPIINILWDRQCPEDKLWHHRLTSAFVTRAITDPS